MYKPEIVLPEGEANGWCSPVSTVFDLCNGLLMYAEVKYLRGTEICDFDKSLPSSLMAAMEAGTRTG